jgi:hypothetical protein
MRLTARTLPTCAGIAVCLALLARHAAAAETFWMQDAELRRTFSASVIEGQYVDGRTFREQYSADNTLDYKESTQARNWTGRWSIVQDRFCTIYDNFGTGGCFRVRRASLNCFEFYFDTRTEEEARQSTLRRPTWTARAWRVDQPATCEERPLV